jgi:hypothetical protein
VEKPKASAVKKLSTLLRGLSVGINGNMGIDVCNLLSYTHEILKTNVADQLVHQCNTASAAAQLEAQKRNKGYRPPNCLLLAPEPKR